MHTHTHTHTFSTLMYTNNLHTITPDAADLFSDSFVPSERQPQAIPPPPQPSTRRLPVKSTQSALELPVTASTPQTEEPSELPRPRLAQVMQQSAPNLLDKYDEKPEQKGGYCRGMEMF